MKKKILITFVIFALTEIIMSQEIMIYGTVVNKNGEPVSNTNVEILESGNSTTTDSLGNFVFNQTPVTIIKKSKEFSCPTYNNASGVLSFHVNNVGDAVTINIYNLKGRLINKRIYTNISPGENNINVFNKISRSYGFYIIELISGNIKSVFKANNINIHEPKKNNITSLRDKYRQQNYTLSFKKDGFKEKQLIVNSNEDINVGNVVLLQYPIAEISNVTNNQELYFGDSITINVNAIDPDDDNVKVTFIIDSVNYSCDSVAPFQYTWNSLRGNIGDIPINVIVEDSDSLVVADSVNLKLVFGNERTYGYEILNTYDHDNTSYTQGLVHADGIFYEGSGLYGESVLRKVDVETGDVIKNINLGSQYFGEGITIWNDTILQLTWRENVIFTYDKESFASFDTLYNPHDGWGITHDNEKLIISDGSSRLYFWNPHTITQFDSVRVYDKNGSLSNLNELEYFYKKVFANIYQTRKIAIINPETGDVLGKIDFTGLSDFSDPQAEVLNGIAYDPIDDRIFITGKHWSNLYEVKLKLLN